MITRRDLDRWGEAGATLLRWGAVRQGVTLTSIICDACGDDHFVELEFDGPTAAWRYYCGSVGFVSVGLEALVTYGNDLDWLIRRLFELLSIQRPENTSLIDGVMWRLGVARLGTRFWTAVLVRDVDRHLDRILEQLQRAGRNHPGLLISSSHALPSKVSLPNDYRWLPLRQLLGAEGGQLQVREAAIEDALTARRSRKSPKAKPGRPGAAELLLPELRRRAASGEMLDRVSAEARHLSSWLAQSQKSVRREPGSVENIIGEAFRELKANQPRSMK